MYKIDVAGLKIDSITKQELLTSIRRRVKAGKKTFLTTPYSEFLYRSLADNSLFDILNEADFAVPDGIGIFWAAKYLALPLTAKSYWGKILQAYWQAKYSLATIIFNRRWIMSAFQEKIPGSELIWDLAKLAVENNLSIYLLGGFGNTPKLVGDQLVSKSVNQLRIAGYSNKSPGDPTIIEDIKKSGADILFVAFGPIKQEKWIVENLDQLSVKFAVGLGGTFDYIAGTKLNPPKWIRSGGLEWLYRLFTQPHRLKRIWQATFGLVSKLVRYKVFMSYPYRKNVVSIILNKTNEILVCKRNPENPDDRRFGFSKNDMLNYWQFPQGGMDEGESITETSLRECREEVGLKHLEVLNISSQKNFYYYPNSNRPLLVRQSKYKGQEQSIVYLKNLQPDDAVKIDNIEFVGYKWVQLERLAYEVHQHRKNVAIIAQQDLKQMFEKAIL